MPKTLYARLALGLVLLLVAIGLVYGLISAPRPASTCSRSTSN